MFHVYGFSILLAVVLSSAHALQSVTSPSNRIMRMTPRLFESTDDEIAQLEEKLRKLKQEKERQEVAESTISEPVEKLDEVPLEMFLTEQWKEKDAATSSDVQSSSGGLTNILYAVGAAVVIAFFSQIPIGQEDLSKYSIGNSPPSEQIDLGDLNRARRSGDL